MKDWAKLLIPADATLLDAMRLLDSSAKQIVLVTDSNRHLLGTLTDGDIRRALLRGVDGEESVISAMNARPTTVYDGQPRASYMGILNARKLQHLPILDKGERIVGLASLDDVIRHDNQVVLMAGGLGTRLHPITQSIPKPMIEVGGKPILQTIVESLVGQGFWRLIISVGYRADDIVEYFGDGSRFGAEIMYLNEHSALGTAGALSLIKERPDSPLLVMNADIITTANLGEVVYFHDSEKFDATLCVREYAIQVPYGVVHVEDGMLKAIEEKPWYRAMVSAGIYVLNPSCIDYIPDNTKIDMPELLLRIANSGRPVGTYTLNDYWIDIGRPEELKKAELEYGAVFGIRTIG